MWALAGLLYCPPTLVFHLTGSRIDEGYEALVQSYYLTRRQRLIGELIRSDSVDLIRHRFTQDGKPRRLDLFFVPDLPPRVAVQAIRRLRPAPEHQIFFLDPNGNRVQTYQRLGGRVLEAHRLMVRSRPDKPHSRSEPTSNNSAKSCELSVQRAQASSEAVLLSAVEGSDVVLAEDVIDPSIDYYYIPRGEEILTYLRLAQMSVDVLWLSHVYTAPSERGKGYASELMRSVLEECDGRGAERIWLLANQLAVDLYRRFGFAEVVDVPVVCLERSRRGRWIRGIV